MPLKPFGIKRLRPETLLSSAMKGPKGGPGMREMLSPTSAIIGSGLGSSVALITDGRFSGATHMARRLVMSLPKLPSAVRLDCWKKETSFPSISRNTKLKLNSQTKELEKRKVKWKPRQPQDYNRLYLAGYSQTCQSWNFQALFCP